MKPLLLLLLLALPLHAAEVGFEAGISEGIFIPNREIPLSYLAYSYLDRLNAIGYYEWTIGEVQAQAFGEVVEVPFVAGALGWTNNHKQGFFVQTSIGLAYLPANERLSTDVNFQLSFLAGIRYEFTSFRCGLRHHSNGSSIIRSPEPNIGEEFVLCGFNFHY